MGTLPVRNEWCAGFAGRLLQPQLSAPSRVPMPVTAPTRHGALFAWGGFPRPRHLSHRVLGAGYSVLRQATGRPSELYRRNIRDAPQDLPQQSLAESAPAFTPLRDTAS